METLIKLEYGLMDFEFIAEEDKYYIKIGNDRYILEETFFTEKDVELINQSRKFYQVIKNKQNRYLTNIKEKKYILYKIDPSTIRNLDYQMKQKNLLDWGILWSKKTDNIRINRNKLPKNIEESLDYYLGLAENSILYWNSIEQKDTIYVLGKKRMNIKNQYHPNNAIIDLKERNIAEKIKNEYFEKEIDKVDTLKILNHAKKQGYNIEIIMSRLLFPTYYFDIVEEYLEKGKIEDARLKRILRKQEQYETILNSIQIEYLNKKEKIKWL